MVSNQTPFHIIKIARVNTLGTSAFWCIDSIGLDGRCTPKMYFLLFKLHTSMAARRVRGTMPAMGAQICTFSLKVDISFLLTETVQCTHTAVSRLSRLRGRIACYGCAHLSTSLTSVPPLLTPPHHH